MHEITLNAILIHFAKMQVFPISGDIYIYIYKLLQSEYCMNKRKSLLQYFDLFKKTSSGKIEQNYYDKIIVLLSPMNVVHE